ncbi:MAG: type II secretion system protein GspC [Syntrophobacteria bacterium]
MKYRWICDILVLSLIVYFAVSATTRVLDARLSVNPAAEPVPVETKATRSCKVRPLEDYAIIAKRNLFGGVSQEQSSPPPEEVDLDGIPQAVKSLGLKLVGTVVAAEPVDNFAIIEDIGTRTQQIYHEGDRLKQTLVKRILRHNVIINTGERDEVLTMEQEENAEQPAARVPNVPPRPSPGARSSMRLEREELESSLEDLNELMQQVRIRPFMEGNRPGGFLVSNIRPGSLFARMGLRNGDVVKGINDQSITSPEQAVELYRSLREGGAVALEVKRGRRRHHLHYEIR